MCRFVFFLTESEEETLHFDFSRSATSIHFRYDIRYTQIPQMKSGPSGSFSFLFEKFLLYDRNNSYAYYLVKDKLKAEEEDLKERRESHVPEKYIYRYMYWVELSYDRDYMIEKYGKETVDRILEKLEHPIRFHSREAAEAAKIAANEAMAVAYVIVLSFFVRLRCESYVIDVSKKYRYKARDYIEEAIRKRRGWKRKQS